MAVTRGQHLIGKRLGSCTLQHLLGYGGSSAVFLAQEEDPERKVAVKVFLPRAGLDGHMQREFYRRFLREADAASKLDHPNILPVYSYGEEDGLPYIVMPYMPGGTLSEHISQYGPLSWLEVQWYLEQLGSALDYAHAHGCVHCDVKPANILLDSEGHVLLSDFGIARLTKTEDGVDIAEASAPRVVMGTPDYISPEQALGRSLDGRSDVYSLAVTVFFLLTKRLPFNADSLIALALLHVHEAPPSLAAFRSDITPALDQVVHKALAKDPRDRFQSAGEFSAAFAVAVLASTAQSRSTRSAHERLADAMAYQFDPVSYDQSIFRADKPITRVKPIKTIKKNLHGSRSHLLLVLVTCLVIAATVGLTVKTVIGALPQASVRSATPIAMSSVASMNLLDDSDNWPTSKTFFFEGESHRYHIVNKSPNEGALALYYNHLFGDFRLTVTMAEMHNSPVALDYYGVIFRATPDQSNYYLFEVAPSRQNHYAFLRYDEQRATPWTMVANGTVPSFMAGPEKKNTLTIEAHGNSFSFEVNSKSIGQPVSDLTKLPLASGLIGLYVEDQGAEVAFSQLNVNSMR